MARRIGRLLAAALLAAAPGAAGAAAGETPCAPRTAEKAGVRFVEVCEAGVFLSAAPLACGTREAERAACDPVTPLESSPFSHPRKNRPVDALVTDAETARRLCRERFGGRLPTSLEREHGRLGLALASLRLREEPGEFARVLLHAQQEWVSDEGRVARYPSVHTARLSAGDVLLACVAEPAQPNAQATAIGGSCDERPVEGGVRSPDCAVLVPGTSARFELGCDPERTVRSRAREEDAAVRCVVPPSALGLPQLSPAR